MFYVIAVLVGVILAVVLVAIVIGRRRRSHQAVMTSADDVSLSGESDQGTEIWEFGMWLWFSEQEWNSD